MSNHTSRMGGVAEPLRVLDLFAGIGGFSLGLERTGGFETVAFCEIEPFPQKVLRKHWPEVPIYDDVRELTGARLAADGIAVDVITGGFPCQDISVAGRRAGIADGTRSGLWSEVARLVGEIRPSYIIVENVANLLRGPSEKRGGWFGRVLGDLAELGYDAQWENIPAASLGAWHRRERVWIVAHPSKANVRTEDHERGEPEIINWHKVWPLNGPMGSDVPDTAGKRLSGPGTSRQPFNTAAQSDWETVKPFDVCLGRVWKTEPSLDRVANGIPNAVDRLAALGNAVVPQIPELIGHAILESIQNFSGKQSEGDRFATSVSFNLHDRPYGEKEQHDHE